MFILADTGILIRLLDRTDPQHAAMRAAMHIIRHRGDRLATSPQNAAEFWNVCTRPASARGGLGLTVQETDRRLRIIERLFPVLADSPTSYIHWRQLVVNIGIQGVQVHDVRLAAFMMAHGIKQLFTLNPSDFVRHPSLTEITPAGLVGASP